MTTYTIGIDTGGTYTDAVIVDSNLNRVVASAKALTSRGDLSIGVIQALEKVLGQTNQTLDRNAISTICLSTTLATNALVEGHGSKVGVVLIGFDDAIAERTGIAKNVEDATIIRIDGGHIYTGEERNALALDQLETALKTGAENLDAYAVTARYATRNSSHERRVQAFIREQTGRPVSISCELSDSLNDPLRALTVSLNAQIISLIAALEHAVQKSLTRLDIDARIMIVKGDGSIGSAQIAVQKPIETILSGPAASVIGAQFLTGLSDFAISDIGGTTSDVAMIKNGWPALAERGTKIGNIQTLVRAIDVQTVGLGGDSEVTVDASGIVQIGQNRVVPISLLASKWPSIVNHLAKTLENKRAMWQASKYIVIPDGMLEAAEKKALTAKDREFLGFLDPEKPLHFYEVIQCASDRIYLARLLQKGIVQISGVTPSDAAHVLGRQSQWSAKAAKLACELLGRASGKISGKEGNQCDDFALEIAEAVITKSSKLIIECLAGEQFNDDNRLVSTCASGAGNIGNLQVALTPNIDVVAVGGPAPVFYPGVGERLGIDIHIPEGSEVANAIGAAISMIKVRAVIEITYSEGGGYLIHHHGAPDYLENGDEAIEHASKLARKQAEQEAKSMGGANMKIEIDVKRIDLPGLDLNNSLMAATITAHIVSELSKDSDQESTV